MEGVLALQSGTETQRSCFVLQYPTDKVIIGDILRAGIETDGVIEQPIGHDNPCEVGGRQFVHWLGEVLLMASVGLGREFESVVSREAERE